MMKIIKHIDRLLSICARKPNLIRRTLRPKCGAGTPTFLSAVYNRGTQAKKKQADVPQCGRSMIEMLGVLAIIGVLTVGSITGYSKAMQQHLLNRQRQQISYILNAIETNHDALNLSANSDLPYYLKPVFETLGWIPEDMIRKNDSIYIYDIFENRMIFSFRSDFLMMNLTIKIDKNAYKQCINFYQTAQQFHTSLHKIYTARYIGNSFSGSGNSDLYGDKYCRLSGYTNRACIKDLTPAQISELCHICDDQDQCDFYWEWK